MECMECKYMKEYVSKELDNREANSKNKRFVSYEEYGRLLNQLVEDIPKGRFAGIYTIPRGGYPVATHLAHHLEIPILSEIELKKYDIENEILLVDDIIHKGLTIKRFHRIKYVAVVFLNQYYYRSISLDDRTIYSAETVSLDTWVVFPWEKPNEEINR